MKDILIYWKPVRAAAERMCLPQKIRARKEAGAAACQAETAVLEAGAAVCQAGTAVLEAGAAACQAETAVLEAGAAVLREEAAVPQAEAERREVPAGREE